MFEDLNSYSETSITIDGINYLELKLFPFYRKWSREHIKRRLIRNCSESRRRGGLACARAAYRFQQGQGRQLGYHSAAGTYSLVIVRRVLISLQVSEHINGVNHVSRIAELADADIDCVRLCVQHFL